MSEVMQRAVDEALAELRLRSKKSIYQTDPVAWASDILGKTLWSKQEETLISIMNNQRTAVRSCNNAGKTATAGVAGAWFIAVHDPHDTVVMCTAPGFTQIKTNLFNEFNINMRASKDVGISLPGVISASSNTAEWKLADGTLLAFGRRPPDKDIISYFQGVHRGNILVIMDEAGGLPRDLFTAAERVTTTGNARILAIGNPDRLGSEFHKMFSPDSDWNQIHISGYDTPNFTNEPFPDHLRKYMLQPDWVERQKRVWGENDPRYKVSILGEFPDADDTVFFPQSIVDRAIDTDIPDDGDVLPELGVDLARFGDDASCIYTYQGGRLRKYATWSKTNAVESANRVHQAAMETGARVVKVDAGGLGGPIIDNLATMCGNHYTLFEMSGAGKTPDPRRWLNARAYGYDMLREKMATGELDIDPDDEDLIAEMGDLNFDFTPKGSIQIESKKDMKARGGKSPDHLDAAVYAAYDVSPQSDPTGIDALTPGDRIYVDPEEYGGAPSWFIGW